MSEFESHEEESEYIKSKSQIKREMSELQDLGKALTELKPEQLKKVPMTEDLAAAIELSKKITQREARRRHFQFIGKLMRDEDTEAIQYAIDEFDSSSERFAQKLHQLEVWRERLISEGNDTLSEFIAAHENVDVQRIRTLIRNARKDRDNQKNTGGAKKLFQYIRSLED